MFSGRCGTWRRPQGTLRVKGKGRCNDLKSLQSLQACNGLMSKRTTCVTPRVVGSSVGPTGIGSTVTTVTPYPEEKGKGKRKRERGERLAYKVVTVVTRTKLRCHEFKRVKNPSRYDCSKRTRTGGRYTPPPRRAMSLNGSTMSEIVTLSFSQIAVVELRRCPRCPSRRHRIDLVSISVASTGTLSTRHVSRVPVDCCSILWFSPDQLDRNRGASSRNPIEWESVACASSSVT